MNEQEEDAVEPQVPLPIRPAMAEAKGNTKLVQITMYVTQADHRRMRAFSIANELSLQRMGHRAWNSFLASYGLPGLTSVSTRRQSRPPEGSSEHRRKPRASS